MEIAPSPAKRLAADTRYFASVVDRWDERDRP